jgi:SAM-dependent methyltransferase
VRPVAAGILRRTSIQWRYVHRYMREFALSLGHSNVVPDVGAGISPYRRHFSCERWVALDIEPEKGLAILVDASNLPIRDGAIDVLVATEVLEHLPDSARALREAWRVIRGGGHLILTTPLVYGIHDKVDYHPWTEIGLIDLVRKQGFEPVAIRRRGGIFHALATLLLQIPLQVFLPRGVRRTLLRSVLYVLSHCLLLPVAWTLRVLDFLDRHQEWTVGYCLLCQRADPSCSLSSSGCC